uniref:Invertebrate defensins family profile domain-containing protein n=1 Tax=Stomoxys calcitrans TaxID=35570 RepID=A0A1I8PFQ1_STOCA
MKFFIIAATCYLAICLFSLAKAAPQFEDSNYVEGVDGLKQVEPELHGRYKRATCDLASGLNWNHSLCAAHCLLRGKRGGYCTSQGVCYCR